MGRRNSNIFICGIFYSVFELHIFILKVKTARAQTDYILFSDNWLVPTHVVSNRQ